VVLLKFLWVTVSLDCEILINTVHLRPTLWAQNDKNYQNQELELKMWEEMAA
jgi:hypothetical protein